MNLALQTRRAVITLFLMAVAIGCVAANTVTRHDALSTQTPVRVERIAVELPAASIKATVKSNVRCEVRVISL